MCDICRVFKLCHACNRNSLDGPGYKLTINKTGLHGYEHNKKETWEVTKNVLHDLNSYLQDDYRRRNTSYEAGFCTKCSKQIAAMEFYKPNRLRIYAHVNLELMLVTYEGLLEFKLIKTQKTNHCVFGRHDTTIRSDWFEDDTGAVWYCRSSWSGGKFHKIKKTKAQVLKDKKSDER